MSASEDSIGSSFNSSTLFSRNDLFESEKYYDSVNLTELNNIDKLSVNQYLVNYRDGTIYLAVGSSQKYDVGTISYKKSYISTQNKHIIAVKNIYNSIYYFNTKDL